ncbi:hypothetical protein [Emcibacter nanhaiensis]|uniref:Uncharacterized protein n=1 Tax=Emcibacter nanhaiensis TaxID=1505037 RepID=A0A501PRJ7_9PROT|nr:hypothetical protein [Emcibacter nanhaiensis]TPD62788.1 hypothetical protein FIV46_01540 [Emcibacter nanhaiensis]
MTVEEKLSSGNWFGKVSAAVILGFLLSIGLTGLVGQITVGGLPGDANKVQFTMWMTAPIWIALLGSCFLFRTGLRAWLGLGAANVVCYGLLFGGRFILG